MKQYAYINVRVGRAFGGKCQEHREIIDQFAARGYRYVGYIPTSLTSYGLIKDMDLIFERDGETD